MLLDANYPLVRIPNASGTAAVASGSAWVNATSDQTLPHSVTSGAGATSTNQQIQIFPGFSGVTDGKGLLDVTLTSSNLSCSSTFNSSAAGDGVTQAASGSWQAVIDVWTSAGRRYVTPAGLSATATTLTWSSGAVSSDPLAALSPSSIVVYSNAGTTLHLSDFVSSWSTAQSIVDTSTSGVHQLNGIVSLATTAVRTGDALSTVGMQVGNLSCTAEDNR
jgi:hypothetical protein